MNPWVARASAGLLLGCSLGLAQDSASGQVLAPYKWKSQKRDTEQDRLVLYNFGPTTMETAGSGAPRRFGSR